MNPTLDPSWVPPRLVLHSDTQVSLVYSLDRPPVLSNLVAVIRVSYQDTRNLQPWSLTELRAVCGGWGFLPPRVAVVEHSTLWFRMEGRGYGVWLYAEMARMAWLHHGCPMVADACHKSSTTEAARRVWASSRLKTYVRSEGLAMQWRKDISALRPVPIPPFGGNKGLNCPDPERQ